MMMSTVTHAVRRVALWSLVAVTAMPVMALSARPALALGPRPNFEMPFDCNTSWTATSYDTGTNLVTGATWDHRNSLDFGQGGAALKTVRASAGGYARLTDGFEGQVTVDHGGGWTTVYQHMTGIQVT